MSPQPSSYSLALKPMRCISPALSPDSTPVGRLVRFHGLYKSQTDFGVGRRLLRLSTEKNLQVSSIEEQQTQSTPQSPQARNSRDFPAILRQNEVRIRSLRNRLQESKEQLRLLNMSQTKFHRGSSSLFPFQERVTKLRANKDRLPKHLVEVQMITTIVKMEMEKLALGTGIPEPDGVSLEEHLQRQHLDFLLNISPPAGKKPKTRLSFPGTGCLRIGTRRRITHFSPHPSVHELPRPEPVFATQSAEPNRRPREQVRTKYSGIPHSKQKPSSLSELAPKHVP